MAPERAMSDLGDRVTGDALRISTFRFSEDKEKKQKQSEMLMYVNLLKGDSQAYPVQYYESNRFDPDKYLAKTPNPDPYKGIGEPPK